MLTLPAIKIRQFNLEFYLLNLMASDVRKLSRFEVLGEEGLHGSKHSRKAKAASVNWRVLEEQVHTRADAFQRPVLRKKIEELTEYYTECCNSGVMPPIPGAVLVFTEERVHFTPSGGNPYVGFLQLSETEGSLRVLDGQHRLLALTALMDSAPEERVWQVQVPAILFSGLPPAVIVEMFVTINAKHTKLNPSLLFELKGRQLYPDPVDCKIHDAIKRLNAEGGPLEGHVKMLGVGRGKVPQAGLAQEMRALVDSLAPPTVGAMRRQQGQAEAGLVGKPLTRNEFDEFTQKLDSFFYVYFDEIRHVFEPIWEKRSYSIRCTTALRAFIQAARPVVSAIYRSGGDQRGVVRRMVAPWEEKVGIQRFAKSEWVQKAAGGGHQTTRLLARELMSALGSPE